MLYVHPQLWSRIGWSKEQTTAKFDPVCVVNCVKRMRATQWTPICNASLSIDNVFLLHCRNLPWPN